MFIIQKNTKAGMTHTGVECETLIEAKARCEEAVEGKEPTTDEADNYFRLEVYELTPSGDLDQVYTTGFYEE